MSKFNLKDHMVKKAVVDQRIMEDFGETPLLLRSKIQQIISQAQQGGERAAIEHFVHGEFASDLVSYLSEELFRDIINHPAMLAAMRGMNYGIGGKISAPGLWTELKHIETDFGNLGGNTTMKNAWTHKMVNDILVNVKNYIHSKGAGRINGETDEIFKAFTETLRTPKNLRNWVDITEQSGDGLRIRTAQVSNYRDSFLATWGREFKQQYDIESANCSGLTPDNFVILWFTDPDRRFAAAENMGIDPNAAVETMNVLSDKLNIDNITTNINNAPLIIQLWSKKSTLAKENEMIGTDIIESGMIPKVTPEDIMKAAGFNPGVITRNFRLAVQKRRGEDEETWYERCADVFNELIGTSDAYRVLDPSQDSPLNQFLSGNEKFLENSTDDLIQTLIREVRKMRPGHPNLKILVDLLETVGLTEDDIGTLNKDLEFKGKQKRPDENPAFAEIGFNCDSKTEVLILDAFRNKFNIPICSYQVTLNSPENCFVNSRGFKMDFCFLADVITDFDENSKPIVEPQIFFAGEAFGYDRRTGKHLVSDVEKIKRETTDKLKQDLAAKTSYEDYETALSSPRFQKSVKEAIEKKLETRTNIIKRFTVPEGQEYASIDGDFKIWKDKDQNGYDTLMSQWVETAEDGSKTYKQDAADPYVKYAIRSSWKEPYETFMTQMSNSNMIFLPPIDTSDSNHLVKLQDNIMKQLDNNLILWRNGEGYGYAVQYVLNYARSNPQYAMEPIIAKYATVSTDAMGQIIKTPAYTDGQLYAMALLKHFDIQHLTIPIYNGVAKDLPIFMLKKYMDECHKLDLEPNKQLALKQKKNLKQQYFSSIINLQEDFLNGRYKDPRVADYQKDVLARRGLIQKIVEQSMQNPELTPKQIKIMAGDAFVPANVDSSNVSWYSFPEDIYGYRRSSKWYGIMR